MLLWPTEREICRVQAVKSFNNGRYGNALHWALRSQDNIYVTSIADLFLRVSIHLLFFVSLDSTIGFPSILPHSITPIPARSFVRMCSRISARKCSSRHGLCFSWNTTISKATIDANNFLRPLNYSSIYWIRKLRPDSMYSVYGIRSLAAQFTLIHSLCFVLAL